MSKRAAFAAALAMAVSISFGAQAQKDSIVLGMVLEPPHLDLVTSPAAAIKEVLYTNVYEGLTRIDRASRVVPSLATEWTLSADGLVYTFKLRRGVKFHDGAELTSAAVATSLARSISAESSNPKKSMLTDVGMSVETPDPNTIIVRLAKPLGLVPYLLGLGEAVVMAPGIIPEAKTQAVGTGPFKFVRWNKGDRIELEKNPAHWNAANIKLSKATFRFVPDQQAAIAAMLAGDIDAFPNIGGTDAVDRLKKEPKLKVAIGNTEGETILAINNKKPPFDDVRVRRALAYAIDRNAIIQGAMSGFGTPIGSHFSPNHPAYVDLTGTYPYDPGKAKALLKEAGQSNLSLTMRLPPPAYAQRSGELIQAMLSQVGVKANIESIQFPQWLEQVFKGKQYDLTIISHTEAFDINIYADPNYYFQYGKPEFKTLIDQALSAPNDELRNKALQDAQRMLADDSVCVFLFMLPKIGVWNAQLTGLWENSPTQANDLTEVAWTQ